jgi:hypothetical protein
VQEEVLLAAPVQRVDGLRVVAGAERGVDQGLGLAACEQRHAVRARQRANLAGDRADLREPTSVDAHLLGEDATPHQTRAQLVQLFLDGCAELAEPLLPRLHGLERSELDALLPIDVDEARHHLLLDRTDRCIALGLGADPDRVAQAHLGGCLDARAQASDDCRRLRRQLRLASDAHQLVLRVDQRLDLAMSELQRRENVGLRDFLGAALHHDQRLARPRHDQLQVALGLLGVGGIHDPFAADATEPHGPDRTEERDLGERERRRRTEEGRQIRRVLAVVSEHGGRHLHLVAEALGKEGPNRAVDETADQDLPIREPRLALEEPARDLARRRCLLDEVHGERKEIDALARRACRHGHEDHAVGVGHEGGSGRLLRHPPRLDREASSAELQRHGLRLEPIRHGDTSPPAAESTAGNSRRTLGPGGDGMRDRGCAKEMRRPSRITDSHIPRGSASSMVGPPGLRAACRSFLF